MHACFTYEAQRRPEQYRIYITVGYSDFCCSECRKSFFSIWAVLKNGKFVLLLLTHYER